MRRPWTTILVFAVAAIAVAALIDVVKDGSDHGRASEPAARPAPTTPLPVCEEGQLALELEDLGGRMPPR